MREIVVQVWYPAFKNAEMTPEPYLDFIDLRAKTLAGAGAIPEFFPSHLNHIYTNGFNPHIFYNSLYQRVPFLPNIPFIR